MRTKEEFDTWFSSHGGDPWGYAGDFVQSRLDRSLAFVRQQVPAAYANAFVELGAFNGDFTARLAGSFPSSRIIANDISQVAIAQAREKAGGFPNVGFDISDLSSFEAPDEIKGIPITLLIMECLYYLGRDEQGPALERLVETLHRPLTFISGPAQGDNVSASFLSETTLVAIMEKQGYAAPEVRVLNWTDELRTLMGGKSDEEHAATAIRLDTDQEFRMRYGRQVIYCFKPG
ncbi:MAG: class I SAM-dependent methyltransferase [Alphaproteobacteria bacterium]